MTGEEFPHTTVGDRRIVTSTHERTGSGRGLMLWALGVVAAAAAIGLVARLVLPREFNSERWASGAGLEEQGNPRWSMIEAAQSVLRVGMTEQELLDVFGTPDWRADDGSYLYTIGCSTGPFSGDPKSLQVELDTTHRVVRWSVGH